MLRNGDEFKIEKSLKIKILWPITNQIQENVLNNNSIVAKLYYKNFSMLLTGDIEEIAERKILDEYKNEFNILKSTVLKVGHHGSKTSSSEDFINVVTPKISLIGVGANNTFGHPSYDVIERLRAMDSKVFRTDENGEISIRINSKGKLKINKIISD